MKVALTFNLKRKFGLQTQRAGGSEYSLIGQSIVRHHTTEACQGRNCCIHNPSDTRVKDYPLYWRSDRGMMERICEHGVGHPDPDDVAFKASTTRTHRESYSVHGCDGCCYEAS